MEKSDQWRQELVDAIDSDLPVQVEDTTGKIIIFGKNLKFPQKKKSDKS